MAVIILEGPDESGKTTLANALMGYYSSAAYIKSPATQRIWDNKWDDWCIRVAANTPSHEVSILDRTPEVSETVYGSVIRGMPRLANPMASLASLIQPAVLMVLCSNSNTLVDAHEATSGYRISEEQHQQIIGGYKIVEQLLRPRGMKMLRWNRWDEEAWSSLVAGLHAMIGQYLQGDKLTGDFETFRKEGIERVK